MSVTCALENLEFSRNNEVDTIYRWNIFCEQSLSAVESNFFHEVEHFFDDWRTHISQDSEALKEFNDSLESFALRLAHNPQIVLSRKCRKVTVRTANDWCGPFIVFEQRSLTKRASLGNLTHFLQVAQCWRLLHQRVINCYMHRRKLIKPVQ